MMRRKIEMFLFEPMNNQPLVTLRILLSLALIYQAFSLGFSLIDLYGNLAITQDGINQYFRKPFTPQLSWLIQKLPTFTEPQVIRGVGLAYLVSLGVLLVGGCPRVSAAIVWFLHWMFMSSSQLSVYGADVFTHVFLFYLIWMPTQNRGKPSWGARLSLRVIQIHLCMVYLSSGIEKALSAQWWNGEVIWRALMLPIYSQFNMSWLAWYPALTKAVGWGTLLVEIGYPIFIWPKKTRRLWIALTIGLHLGIGVFLGLEFFSLIMAILTLSLFGVTVRSRPFEAQVMGNERLATGSLQNPIVFFDGDCSLCQGFIRFLIRVDRNQKLFFAPIKGETAQNLLSDQQREKDSVWGDSIAFYEGGVIFFASTAAIKSLASVGGGWRMIRALLFCPTTIRDKAYFLIAKGRHRWRKKESSVCLSIKNVHSRILA